MKKLTKALSCVLAIALLAALAACGAAPSQPADSAGESAATAAPANAAAEPGETAGDKPTLVYWDMNYGPEATYGTAVQKVIDLYNSEDHAANIEVQMLGWDGFYEVFMTAVTSGNAPDISTGAYPGPVQYAAMDEALDLTGIVDKWRAENNPILEDFLPGALELHQYDGKQVAIPFNMDPRGIYYRADLLEDELGFTDLDKVVTWDKLLEICAAIQEKYGSEGIYGISFPVTNAGSMHTMVNFCLSNGTNWVDSTGGQANYNDPKALETMEFIGQLFDSGYIPPDNSSYDGAGAERLYAAEKVGMVWSSPPAFLYDNPDLLARTKVMGPIEGPSSNGARLNSWMNGVMGYSQTEHPDAVLEFLEWLPFNNLVVSIEGGSNALPIRQSFWEDEFFKTDYLRSQYCRYAEYYVNPVWPSPQCMPAFGQVEGDGSIGKPLEALLTGSKDYAGDLAAANDSINAAFENYAS